MVHYALPTDASILESRDAQLVRALITRRSEYQKARVRMRDVPTVVDGRVYHVQPAVLAWGGYTAARPARIVYLGALFHGCGC